MDYFVGILLNTGIFIILALSLNLINGLCGQFSLGHAGFWGVGAYCSAIYSVYYPLPIPLILSMITAIVIGFIASAFCGLIIGATCLRLKGDYLAIATLSFGEIFRIIFMNSELVGGPRGFSNIPKSANIYWVYIFVVLTTIFLLNLKRSAFGRAIISIREDEIAAEILGGLGSITGAIIGAILLINIPEFLKFMPKEISQFRMLIYPLLLIVLMLLRPGGIFGSYEWGERKKMKNRVQV